MKKEEIMQAVSYEIILLLSKIEPSERLYILNTLIPLTYCLECGDYITDCPHDGEF
jgi:hypothetical protein